MGSSVIAARRAALLAAAACGVAALPGSPARAGSPVAASAATPASPVVPTDDLYAEQSALQPGATLGAPTAWTFTKGRGAVVAVLDTGVDEGHRDLQGQLWTNPGEIPGNGRDDDGDGYVDDVHGTDLVNGDGDPSDDEGHGTHIAGIIAAKMDGEGAVGLAPEARIMAVKVLDSHRGGTTDTVAEGIRYAIAHDADVINVSVNGAGTSDDLHAAIRAAAAAGITVVASAGNDGDDLGLVPSYPASYTDANVLAVAATDEHNLLAAFSNFGHGVDLTAPGVDIASTSSTGGYELRSGTSMAAPFVTAAMALLHSARPDMSDADLRGALLATARESRGLLGKIDAGAADVADALRRVVPEAQWPTQPAPPTLTVRVKKRTKAKALITWSLTGDASQIRGWRVSLGGHVLARRSGAGARGIYVPRRKGVASLVALGASGARVAVARVPLK